MSETGSKLPVKKEGSEVQRSSATQNWHPMASLRREIDRLFEDFGFSDRLAPFRRSLFDIEPFVGRERLMVSAPAVDISETDNAYQITADLPGLDEKDIEVKLANGCLTIKGEKHEDKEEKNKDYYLHERSFGSFERLFRLPEGVDADKIEASFEKGVLAVSLPKTPDSRKSEKKIAVKVS